MSANGECKDGKEERADHFLRLHADSPPIPSCLMSAAISLLSCGGRPSVAELPSYTVPPVFPGG